MWKMKFKTEDFKMEGIVPVIIEDCPNPKCASENLRYPTSYDGANCPLCKVKLPGNEFTKYQYSRRQYHLCLAHCTINKVMSCIA